jgi:hypothetical protein
MVKGENKGPLYPAQETINNADDTVLHDKKCTKAVYMVNNS